MRLAYIYPEHLGHSPARLIQVAGTCRGLAGQEGVELHLLVGRYRGLKQRIHQLGLEGVRLHPLLMLQPGPRAKVRLSWHMPLHMAAGVVLRRLRPDAVIVRHLKLAAWLLAHLPEIPLIYEAHELFWVTAEEEAMAPRRLQRLRQMERWVLGRAAAVVAISQPLAEEIKAWANPQVVEVVPCGVDDEFFLDPARPRDLGLAVYVGGLGEWKGVEVVVEAASLVPEARVVIMGGEPTSGAYRALARRIEALGVGGRVSLRPKAGRGQVRQLLARAGIGLWPGTARRAIAACFTSPLKVFEYMAAACAVVAPRVPAAQGLVEDGINALVFEPDQPASMARALERLVRDRQLVLRLGRNAAARARQFTWANRGRRLVELARAVAGR